MAGPSDPRGVTARRGRLGTAIAFALLVAALLATFAPSSDGQILGNDAVFYARAIAAGDGEGIALANHLLPHLAAALVFALGTAIGVLEDSTLGALLAQQVVSAASGAAAVLLVAALAGQLASSRTVGVLTGAVFACAAGPWLYAAVGETYLPAVAVEAWVVLATLRAARGGDRSGLVAAIALAPLVRQDAVLVLLVPLVALRGRALRPLAIGAAIATAGFVTAWLVVPTERSFAEWLLGIAGDAAWGAGAARPEFLFAAQVHLVIVLDAFAYGVHRVFAEPLHGAVALLPVPLLAFAALVGRRGANPAASDTASAVPRGFVAALALALAARLAFFTWWQPSNLEYATGHLVPILALGATCFTSRSLPLLALVAAVELGVNAATLVAPFRGDDLHADARTVLAAAGPGGAAIALDPWAHLALLRAADGEVDLVDGSGALDDAHIGAIVADARRRLDAGARTVGASNATVAERLGLPDAEPDPRLTGALVGLVPFRRLGTRGGLAGYVLEGESP